MRILLFILFVCVFDLQGSAANSKSVKLRAKPDSDSRKLNMLRDIWAKAERNYPCMVAARSAHPESYDLACILAAYDLKDSSKSLGKMNGFKKIIDELEYQYDQKYAEKLEHEIR